MQEYTIVHENIDTIIQLLTFVEVDMKYYWTIFKFGTDTP